MKINTGSERWVNEAGTAYGRSADIGIYVLASVYNSLAAAGAECVGVEADIVLPAAASEANRGPRMETGARRTRRVPAGQAAHEIEKAVRKACRQRGIELKQVKAAQNPMFTVPAVTVSGIGRSRADELWCQSPGRAGEEIVLVKWIGMEGMLRIADEMETELQRRFAPVFIRQIQSYKEELFAGKELEIAKAAGVRTVRQIAEGGILAALWNLAKETEAGLDLDLKRMSVLQETIEVCEHYRLNPYQLTSAGSFLMLTEDGKALAEAMQDQQISASVIGKLTEGNDKVIHNGGDVRYIDRPSPDEIYKIYLL